MSRTSHRPMAVLGLVAALLADVGCSSRIETSQGTGTGTTTAPSTPKSSAARGDVGAGKLFGDWPTPAGALIVSGEQDGYLEPCGCTSGQQGGLRRRFELVARLLDRGWPLTLIDLGSLIKDPATARGGPDQVKIKLVVSLNALGLMKYDALALSAEDLKVGVGEALGQFLNLGERPKVVVANVSATGFEAVMPPSLRTSAGPLKVGITAVLDPDAFRSIKDADKDALLAIKPPAEALPAVLADLKKDTDVQVLMVQGAPERARALAEAFPDFDVVVGTSRFADPAADPERLNGGKTMLVTVGHKGKYVGVVGLFRDPNQPLRYRRVSLDHRFDGPAEPMRKLIEEEFQHMLEREHVVENYPRHAYVGGTPGATFVGAETCKSCHPNTFNKWASTRHARAFEDIVHDPKGVRSDHQFDAECVSCHTTGFEYTSGWQSAEKTSYLKGNQCENCHGPASKHVSDPGNPEFRKAIARTAADADRNRFCIRCHDEDNSPHFEFATYWGQIAHKGLDTYTDAKVRRGPAPKVARQGER